MSGMVAGLDKVLEGLRKAQEGIVNEASKGLLKAALHLEARAKQLAPIDTANLMNSIAAQDKVKRGPDYLRVEITCLATSGAGVTKGGEPGEVYSEKVHENMEYDGPNVGGSRSQGRGPKTLARPVSQIEPSDGGAGGKFLERPLRNKPEVYERIVAKTVEKYLSGGGS